MTDLSVVSVVRSRTATESWRPRAVAPSVRLRAVPAWTGRRLTFGRPDAVVLVALSAVAVFRTVVIGIHGEPSGLDFGNWLMLGHQALGHPLPDAAHVTYPPVVPVLAVAFVNLFGVVWGTALLAGLSSVAPALGVYLAARLFQVGWPAVPGVVLLAATSSSGEAAAWGGVPQLLGLGLTALALGLAQQLLAGERRWTTAAALGATLLALGGTSHLILAQAAAALAGLIVIAALVRRDRFGRGSWSGRNGWIAVGTIAAAPLALLIPLYAKLLGTVGQSFVSQGSGSTRSPANEFVQALSVIYRDVPWLWKPALVLTAATPILLIRTLPRSPMVAITAALIASLSAGAFLSGQDRLVYLAPVAVAFALPQWLVLARRPRSVRWITIVVIIAVGWMSFRGLEFFPAQRAFYGANQPSGTVAGLDWLRTHTPPDALVAVAPINGAAFGWWVQGYSQRSALVGSEDRWLNFPDERARAHEVITLLSDPDPLAPAVLTQARSLGVSYLVLPWAWGGVSAAQVAVHASVVVFENTAMVIVKVPS